MSNPNQQQPKTIGEQLGLGVQWAPSPQQWSWRKLDAPDGTKLHLLTIYSVTGTTSLVLNDESLERFAMQLSSHRFGIALPSTPTIIKPGEQ